MPKLLLPPLRARQRSGRALALALTMAPDARTIYGRWLSNLIRLSWKDPTSKFTTLSHAHPSRGAK